LEAQLLQSQKMDAIGQLAGGVAHDFNNLLMVISSYAELALEPLAPEHPLHRNFEEILKAARRAADLTRQLLAFSRKQMQSLQVLDFNNVLQDLGRMLPRLIGEDIQLELICGADLGKVKADPVQIEQIIMNLAANARDAMPQGGKLTLETTNVHLDEAYVHRRPIVPLGHYVLLTVTDSGHGIPPEHLPHIFEPFFTTKEEGKGTGLGLATVYGIVKQNGGFIWVYSEPGMGTTFKIYLPEVEMYASKSEPAERLLDSPKGNETLLLVEDEEAVRLPECEFLRFCGYTVLEAHDGRHALEVARAYDGNIHLMITDVVMPHMSGGEAATELRKERGSMKVLYVSGYANPTVLQHGVNNSDATLLQKPFTLKLLAQKVRQALA
jgi:CheY-like chemotaxis protein